MWGQLGAGACLTARAHQACVASVLSFVGQLEPLPEEFDAAEGRACAALFPGPTDWITAGCLADLRSLGFPWELRDVRAAAVASKARAVRFEAQGNLQVHARARRMEALRSFVDSKLARDAWLGTWRSRCYLLQLARADIQVSRMIHASPKVDLRLQDSQGWQRRITAVCRGPHGAQAQRHLRRRLDLWRIAALPGLRPDRAVRHLHHLASSGHPRVLAVYLRTIFNGWCTNHRSQGAGPCRFACGGGRDKLEHVTFSPTVKALFSEFHLPPASGLGVGHFFRTAGVAGAGGHLSGYPMPLAGRSTMRVATSARGLSPRSGGGRPRHRRL